MWLQLVTTIVLGVGIGVLAQPQLIVRFMTVKSNREIHRGLLVGGIFILMMTGVAFTVGALTNVYFVNNPAFGKISIIAAAKNVDNIIPLFINAAMPPWFTAVFMITLLAAAMSTLSSQFHTMGTAAGRDFYEQGLGMKTGSSIYITRMAMAIAIILSLFIALFLPRFLEKGSAIIAIGTAIFFGLCAATFLPMYFGALYTKRITKNGALSGFFTGAFASILWMAFVHSKESVPMGLCKAIFRVDTLAGASKWQYMDPLIIALPLSIVVTIAVSMMTKAPTEEHLKKCFEGI
jgi:SSS family solute:Na+ symporter